MIRKSRRNRERDVVTHNKFTRYSNGSTSLELASTKNSLWIGSITKPSVLGQPELRNDISKSNELMMLSDKLNMIESTIIGHSTIHSCYFFFYLEGLPVLKNFGKKFCQRNQKLKFSWIQSLVCLRYAETFFQNNY